MDEEPKYLVASVWGCGYPTYGMKRRVRELLQKYGNRNKNIYFKQLSSAAVKGLNENDRNGGPAVGRGLLLAQQKTENTGAGI